MTEPAAPAFPALTLTMTSWKAPATVEATLASFRAAGILDLFADRIIHFNEMSAADEAVATRYGFTAIGRPDNAGIFGAVDALAARVATPYVLSVENDTPVVTGRDGFIAMVSSVLADMATLDVPVFLMRSRRQPGEPWGRRWKYDKHFRPVWPLGTPEAERRRLPHVAIRTFEDMRRSPLRGAAIFAEEDPTIRHPRIVRRTPAGNWLTDGRYLSWSNCCFLARTDFLRGVVLERVRTHPAPVTLNGHQDIEAALKHRGWWRRRAFPIGQCEPGPFTHLRLDR